MCWISIFHLNLIKFTLDLHRRPAFDKCPVLTITSTRTSPRSQRLPTPRVAILPSRRRPRRRRRHRPLESHAHFRQVPLDGSRVAPPGSTLARRFASLRWRSAHHGHGLPELQIAYETGAPIPVDQLFVVMPQGRARRPPAFVSPTVSA